MDSLFAKAVFLFSFLLASIASPGYIKIAENELDFNFKTGEIYPIYYYLNTQNIGSKKARFEIFSDQSWVSGYREGTNFVFVELPPQAYINFVLEIRPERLPDGINKAKVFVKVLDIDSLVSQEVVLDEAEVLITLNKNFAPAPKVSPEVSPEISPALTASPQPTSLFSPALTPAQTLIETPFPTQIPVLTLTPSPLKPSFPLPKINPVKTQTMTPTFSPAESPIPSFSLNPTLKQIQSLIDSIRLFLKKIF